jgi:hypothetical protein
VAAQGVPHEDLVPILDPLTLNFLCVGRSGVWSSWGSQRQPPLLQSSVATRQRSHLVWPSRPPPSTTACIKPLTSPPHSPRLKQGADGVCLRCFCELKVTYQFTVFSISL